MTLKEKVNIVSKYFMHSLFQLVSFLNIGFWSFFVFDFGTAFSSGSAHYSYGRTLRGVCYSLSSLAGFTLSGGSVCRTGVN